MEVVERRDNNVSYQSEKELCKTLWKLADTWPRDYWLWAASGTLYLMRNIDGERAMTPNGYVDPGAIVEQFNIPCDGGDW